MMIWRKKTYDVVVVSFGGAGTTFLLKFLRRKLRANSHNSQDDGIKHVDGPMHPALQVLKISRAIYVYDNPIRAVCSLFRRGYQVHMIPKLASQHTNAQDFNRFVSENLRHIEFSEFLALGQDLFGIKRHWRQWSAGAASFPIMMLKYDAIHESVPQILEFLSLPASAAADFPARVDRASNVNLLASHEASVLKTLYGDICDEMNKLPPVAVLPAIEVGSRKSLFRNSDGQRDLGRVRAK